MTEPSEPAATPASALIDRLTTTLAYDEDWPIADPAKAADEAGVEPIRDGIDARVRHLLGSLLPGLALPELTHPKPS